MNDRFMCAACDKDADGPCPCPPVEARERQAGIVDEILAERKRQDARWGIQNHAPAVWAMILGEEVGEAVAEMARPECAHGDALQALVEAGEQCKSVCDDVDQWMKHDHMTEGEIARYRAEMVQVAAVALSAIECLDRNAGRKPNA